MLVNKHIKESLVFSDLDIHRTCEDPGVMDVLSCMADMAYVTLAGKHKILICGNGGSAADAQHIAAELVGRFEIPGRSPLAAIALTTDTSIITAITNDIEFDQVFERQVRALGQPGDLLWCLSTSGCSQNINRALHTAGDIGMNRILFTSRQPTKPNVALRQCRYDHVYAPEVLCAANAQTCHQIAYHAICRAIDHATNGAT